jgi:translocation and assembly module TamB
VPGATLALKGDAQPDRGAGTLRANVANATRLLAWARKLPGASPVLQGVQASGHASLQGSWQGGWRDPALQIQLAAPQLDVQPPDAGQALVQLRGLSATLSGRLAQAQLAVDGRVSQGARQLDLRLAANGGRTTPAAPLAQSGWRLVLARLQAGVRDPALGPGSWQLATRAPVQLQWSPQQGGQFEAGAGELTVASPPPVAQAVVAWGPARWRAGDLRSTGRLTGLPLEWAERLAGTRLADAGLTGSVVFNGDWDVALGRELRLHAQLARASGDLTVLATDAQTGVQSRVAAGLREARLTLSSTGTALNLALRWDSTHAGTIDGTLRTELAAHADGGGTQWSWPGQAPLQGQVQARLPQLSAWSVLAPPGWRLRGALQADARITGTRAAPQWSGTLAADDLALRSVVDGLQFGGGRLRARLDGTRLLVDEFLLRGAGAQGSGGTLRASGEAGWAQGRAQARLSATLDKLRASIRADRQLTVSGHLTAALDGRQIQTDGRLRVDRARIELPDDSAPRLGSDVVVRGPDGRAATGKTAPGTVALPTSSAGQRGAETPASSQTSPLTAKAEVQIDLGDDFRLHGMGIDTRLAGVLTLSAHGPITAMPRIHGTVHTVDGTVQAYSQQLNIRRGQIAFTGDAANPTLDIIALRPNYASDQQVGAQVQGTALLPRVRLYSQPALPDNETLAWLLLGRAAPSSGAEAAMLQSAALALLGGREGRGLASRLGLDELSFSGGTSGGLADASVTLGKRLSDRLYAAYEHSLAGASGTLLIFYELSRRWTVRGQAGENAAVDLIYRLSFD